MAVIYIKDFVGDNDFLGSRKDGAKIRKQIENYLKVEENVTMNFAHIRSITQSFADEIVGILVRTYGFDFVKKRLKIVNYNDDIKNTFNYVALYSKKMGA